jgi:hypothetical protein
MANQPTGEWVSMAVLVERSEVKKSANSNEYIIWHIADLTVRFYT